MTPAELITYINDNITTNGNNEITADVLRPVLIAMVNQINALVGDEGNLPGGADNVIDAINNLPTAGIVIHTGMDNPNDTPPVSFALGDFYSQTNVSEDIIAFWQYNGLLWTEIISKYEQQLRGVREVVGSTTVDGELDNIVVYDGTSGSDTITLPIAFNFSGKILTIVNISAVTINMTTFKDVRNIDTNTINGQSVIRLVSNSAHWKQINNN